LHVLRDINRRVATFAMPARRKSGRRFMSSCRLTGRLRNA
jgi:hypothetical protein